MTATPIPRTLSLTAYGDLDTTTLRELPAGRAPGQDLGRKRTQAGGAYEFIRERLREGRQAYVVCPLVSESEKLQARAAEARPSGWPAASSATSRSGDPRADAARRQGSGDGAIRSGRRMSSWRRRVIEVGIDVPNATVMLVEGAERYGVSQLHQLRGRVGRGGHESYCILFGDAEGRANWRAGASRRWPPARRLRARRGRPEPARRGRDTRHPPARPAAVPRRGAPRGHGDAARGRRGGARDARRARTRSRRRSSGPLMDEVRRRFGDERAGADRGMKGGSAEASCAAGRSRAAGRRGAADHRPRAGGDLLGARRRRRRRVLDLYCGTGALGIEAISRGAAQATLVDRDTRRPSATSKTSACASASSWCAPTRRAGSNAGGRVRSRLRRRPI